MHYNALLKKVHLDKIAYLLLCLYVLFSCLDNLGANRFLRAGVIVGIFYLVLQFPKVHCKTKHLYYIGFFLGALIFTIFFNPVGGNYYAGLRMIRSDYVLTLMPMALILLFVRTKEQLQVLLICLLTSFTMGNLFAIPEYFSGVQRVDGMSGGIMQLASALILLIPTFYLLYADRDFMLKYKRFLIAALIIALPVVFFNATRIVWIALTVTMPIAIFMNMGRFQIKTIAAVVVIAAVFFGIGSLLPSTKSRLDVMFDPTYQSNSERKLMWNSAWNMFKDHPLFGIGLGNYKDLYFGRYISPDAKEETVHAHSNIMHLAATTGILGAGAYIAMSGYFLYESFQNWRRTRNTAPILFFCATLGFLIHGLTDYNIGFIGVSAKIYWMILGIYLVMDQLIIVENR